MPHIYQRKPTFDPIEAGPESARQLARVGCRQRSRLWGEAYAFTTDGVNWVTTRRMPNNPDAYRSIIKSIRGAEAQTVK